MSLSDSQPPPFRRPPRRKNPSVDYDQKNIRNELKMILQRARSVAAGSRDDFSDGTPLYDTASMAVVRLASLTERAEFGPWMGVLTEQEIVGIRATRNIVAHAGYTTMDDDIFWTTVTESLPAIVERLLSCGE